MINRPPYISMAMNTGRFWCKAGKRPGTLKVGCSPLGAPIYESGYVYHRIKLAAIELDKRDFPGLPHVANNSLNFSTNYLSISKSEVHLVPTKYVNGICVAPFSVIEFIENLLFAYLSGENFRCRYGFPAYIFMTYNCTLLPLVEVRRVAFRQLMRKTRFGLNCLLIMVFLFMAIVSFVSFVRL